MLCGLLLGISRLLPCQDICSHFHSFIKHLLGSGHYANQLGIRFWPRCTKFFPLQILKTGRGYRKISKHWSHNRVNVMIEGKCDTLELWESPHSNLGSGRWFGEEVFQAEEKVTPGLELRERSTFCQLRVVQSGLHVKYKGVVNFFRRC